MVLGWNSWTSWLLGGVVTLIVVKIWRARQNYLNWKKELGLPGPSFTGSTIPFFTKGIMETFDMFQREYGKVYCVASPSGNGIVVSDLDLLREVMVKQFADFPNRLEVTKLGKPWDDQLIALKDDHWKHVRGQLSPAFSTGKIKKMMPSIQRVCASLQDVLKKKAESGEPVELKKLAGEFSLDVIAGVAFGIDSDSLHNPDEPFVKYAGDFEKPRIILATILVIFPRLFQVLRKIGFGILPTAATNFFLKIIDAALKESREEETKRCDFLKLLLEAEKEGEQQKQVDKEIDHGDQLATSTQWTRKGLTLDEMRSNSVIFILAGYGTVSTVVSFSLFCLAANPQCLEKVQKEVDEKLGKRLVDYDTVSELTYLDMCMNEALRLFPPGFILNREAHEDTDLNGIPLKKGMPVTIPVYSIHTDPGLWPDPMKFDPERHTPEARANRHQFAFMPFGMGPRNCIGMRLAQLEVKMALASVLQKFSPKLCSKSVYPPKLEKIRMQAKDGLWVTFEARE